MNEYILKSTVLEKLEDLGLALREDGHNKRAKGVFEAIDAVTSIPPVFRELDIEDYLIKNDIKDLDSTIQEITSENKEQILHNIRYSFKASGMSYKDFYKLTLIPPSTLRRYLTFGYNVPDDKIEKMLKALQKNELYKEDL
jgi:hypothetical protein